MERSIRSRFGSYAKSSESLNRVPRAYSPRTDFHPTVGFAPRQQGRLGGGHRPVKQSGGVAESRREPPCAAASALRKRVHRRRVAPAAERAGGTGRSLA